MSGRPDITSQYRSYQARLDGAYVDLRGEDAPDLYRADDYASGQAFGAAVRASSHAGIVYRSVRDPAGTNVVAFRPPAVQDVLHGAHWQLTVPLAGRIVVRRL